jgi:hypothetical protein
MKRLGKGCFGDSERIMGISIISYGKNSLDLRPALVNELSSWVKGPLYTGEGPQ